METAERGRHVRAVPARLLTRRIGIDLVHRGGVRGRHRAVASRRAPGFQVHRARIPAPPPSITGPGRVTAKVARLADHQYVARAVCDLRERHIRVVVHHPVVEKIHTVGRGGADRAVWCRPPAADSLVIRTGHVCQLAVDDSRGAAELRIGLELRASIVGIWPIIAGCCPERLVHVVLRVAIEAVDKWQNKHRPGRAHDAGRLGGIHCHPIARRVAPAGALQHAGAAGRQGFPGRLEVENSDRQLTDVVGAGRPPRRLPRGLHRRQQETDERADDRDHDQELDERETVAQSRRNPHNTHAKPPLRSYHKFNLPTPRWRIAPASPCRVSKFYPQRPK